MPHAPRPLGPTPRPLGPSAPRPPTSLAPGLSAPAATATAAAAATAAPTATAAPAYCATMALLRVLAFDHEGRPVQFHTWLDGLSDSKDSVSLFDLAAGAATAPPAATDSALYNAVVARYSSPATAALGCLLLPYLFLELSAFATVEDLVSRLRASDARYHAAAPAEFLVKNQPPMLITLYFIVTRLPDSLRSVKDHFLSLDPTSLTVDLLEQHLLAAETSAVAVGAARGTPRPPFFEGATAARARVARVVGVAAVVVEVAVGVVVGAAVEVVVAVGLVEGVGVLVAAVEAAVGVVAVAAVGMVAVVLALGMLVLEVASVSSSCVGARHSRPSNFLHTQHRCFSRLNDAWRAEFGDDVELPRWADLLRSRIAIFDLDFDAMVSAMYALSFSAESDCYQCVPPDQGIAAAALRASESGTLPGTAPAQALHTFTLDSGASRCFFRDSTTLTPLHAPVPVRLADPSGGPVVARSSIVLPCPAVPSGSLSGLHLRSFSTNLVSTAALQDAMVTTSTPGGQHVSICTCTRTGRHLATFTRRPGSILYTLATEPPQVNASAQVSASGQVAASCSCRLLSHQTLMWHHRLGHPSLPRLRGMHSRVLVSGLPRSLPPLPPSPAPPCLLYVEGRQHTAPHSSSFPLTTAPLQTLHMDVWDPARVIGAVRLQLRERFGQDLPVLYLHSDRGGEFSSNLLWDFCRGEGILQTFTLPESPQQNGIAECRIGLVMEVARTSMVHAAAPHFRWSFAVRYAAHQLNLWPHVSLPETSPTLRWMGEVGDASVFWVWGSRTFVRDTTADKLSSRAIPCVFLGFLPNAPGWQFYHPTSRHVLPSQDVTFDESNPFYRLFPYRSAPPPPPSLFLAPGPPLVDPLQPQGLAPSGVSQVDPPPGTVPVEVAVGSGAARGAASGGAASGGAEPGGAGSEGAGSGGAEPGGEELGGAEPEGVEPGGAESKDAESGGAKPRGAASTEGPAGALPRLSPQQLREWLVRRARLWSGAPGAGGAGDAGAGGAGVTAGASGSGGTTAAGPEGARTRGSCAGGAGAGGAGAGGVGVGGTGAGGGGAAGAGDVDPGGLIERRELASRPVLPVRTARRVPRSCPPPVPCTHAMALCPSSVPLRVPLPAPPESSLLEVPDPESDRARAPCLTVSRLFATAVTHRSFESAVASALVAELIDFAAACHLDYATALVVESESASPPSVGGEYALGTDVLKDRVLLHVAAERDYELHSLDFSTAFLQGSVHEEIRLCRPPGFTESFHAGTQWSLRRPVYGLRQAPRELNDTLRTTLAALGFAPASADRSLFLRTDTSMPPFYVLVYVNDLVFATADTEALTLVKLELQKRQTCTDLGELHIYLGLQITRDRARRTITVTQSYMVHQVLQRFGFQFSSPQPTPLSTSHSLSAPPSDESVEPSEGTALLVQYVGLGARAWRMGSSCPHRSCRRFLG
ncbi:unnamed protein product [Closterium sp. NIES-54]